MNFILSLKFKLHLPTWSWFKSHMVKTLISIYVHILPFIDKVSLKIWCVCVCDVFSDISLKPSPFTWHLSQTISPFTWHLSQTISPFTVLLVSLEISGWVRVQQGGLVMFRHMLQELLNIEQFCKRMRRLQLFSHISDII